MKKLTTYLDDESHGDVKALALRKRTTMSALIRYALHKTLEDDLDIVAGEQALEETTRDPAGLMTLDQYLEERSLPRAEP